MSARFAKGSYLAVSTYVNHSVGCACITFFPRDLAIRAADFSSILVGPIAMVGD